MRELTNQEFGQMLSIFYREVKGRLHLNQIGEKFNSSTLTVCNWLLTQYFKSEWVKLPCQIQYSNSLI